MKLLIPDYSLLTTPLCLSPIALLESFPLRHFLLVRPPGVAGACADAVGHDVGPALLLREFVADVEGAIAEVSRLGLISGEKAGAGPCDAADVLRGIDGQGYKGASSPSSLTMTSARVFRLLSISCMTK